MNASVFWVTNNLMDDWIQLPDIQPEQLVASRKFVRLLTGNLNAEVNSNPAFPGKERHLLRAQLARIQHTCELVLKDEYTIEEEGEDENVKMVVKPAEEFSVPPTSELQSLENWVHKHPVILKAGRCSHYEPKGTMDEEALAEYMDKLKETDPEKDRFMAVNEDEQIKGVEAWSSSIGGDQTQYKTGDGTTTYAVNIIKSNRWPGATTLTKDGKYFFIYIGDAVKKGADFFNPTEPPEIMPDPKEPTEEPEPNGKDPEPEKPEGEEGEEDDE